MNVIGGRTMFGSDKRIRQRANAIAKLPGRAIGGAFNALILPIRKPVIEVIREVEVIRESIIDRIVGAVSCERLCLVGYVAIIFLVGYLAIIFVAALMYGGSPTGRRMDVASALPTVDELLGPPCLQERVADAVKQAQLLIQPRS